MSDNISIKHCKNIVANELGMEVLRLGNEVSIILRKNQQEEVTEKMRNLQYVPSPGEKDIDCGNDLEFVVLGASLADFEHPIEQLKVVRKLILLLSKSLPQAHDQIVKHGIANRLIDCFKVDNPMLHDEVSLLLTYLASCRHTAEQLIRGGAVRVLLRYLSGPIEKTSSYAVLVLGNLICHCSDVPDLVIREGIVEALVQLGKPDAPLDLLRPVSWLIMLVCFCGVTPLNVTIVHNILPTIKQLLTHSDLTILEDATKTILYLSDNGLEITKALYAADVIPNLVDILGRPEQKLQMCVLDTIFNFTSKHNVFVPLIMNTSMVEQFAALNAHGTGPVRHRIIKVIISCVADQPERVQMFLDIGLVPILIAFVQNGLGQTQDCAVNAICKLISMGSPDQFVLLVNCGIISAFCHSLESDNPNTVMIALIALSTLLEWRKPQTAHDIEECDGLEKIENLFQHTNPDISKIAHTVVEHYFNESYADSIIAEEDKNSDHYIVELDENKNHSI